MVGRMFRVTSRSRGWVFAGRLAAFLAVAGGGLGCSASSSPEAAAYASWSWCRLEGVGRAVRCARVPLAADGGGDVVAPVSVDDDHDGSRGPRHVFVAVVPAEADERAEDPIVLLAGGPGQAATTSFGPMLPAMTRWNRNRDLILVDIRGTERGSAHYCSPEPDDDDAEIDQLFAEDGITAGARACLETLDAPALAARSEFTTTHYVRDLDVVRRALGVTRWNLVGVSYGTRLAMQYAKAHPSHTRTLVLDAVAPASLRLPLPFAEDMERSWDAVAERCRDEAPCRDNNGDPRAHLTTLLEGLPRPFVVHHPRTGRRREVVLKRGVLAQLLRGPLYATELQALLPHAVRRAGEGDLAPLLGPAALMDGADLALGVLLSVVCAEDVPRIRDEEVEPATAGTVLGAGVVHDFRRACAAWGVPPASLDSGPLPEGLPVMTISGTVDPVTPVRWADVATEGVRQHHRVVVPHAGHGNLIRGCMPGLVETFLATPDAPLDATCVADETAPALFLDPAGGAP